ncbi:MAG TPA: glycoside hydrolase family 9 protein, partial [Cytophagales bacterium]|nr:glycoside hydrolase family 9 protein [Cytophagales bacterium]
YITTKEETYFPSVPNSFPLAGWPSVGILGCYSLLQYQDSLTQVGIDNLSKAKKIVLDRATERDVAYKNSAYKTFVLPGDFYWGSNSVVLNASMNHYFAYKLNNNKEYLDAMSHTFDYILGKNPLSISYVTKYGAYAPVSPHHRISGSLRKVLPGMVVGGPNPHNISDCTPSPYPLEYSYVSKLPALSYFDNTCSYSTNETAINWNAPLVFTVASLLKEYSCEGQSLEHVTFDSLSIKKNGCEVDIAFYTKNEQNVHSYIIEKSEDGRTFTKFAEVLNNHTGVYLFHDNNLGMKKVYYKVRAAEMLSDAILFTNSEIASVDFIADYLLVYPIPVDELLTIELPCYTSGSYKVHDTYGHFVSEGILPSPYNLIHVSSWRSGIYVFTINANGRTEKKRVMVK